MPMRFISQAVPRAKSMWNGDVWKNIVESRTRPEIDTYVVHADHGVGMILKKPNNKILKLDISNFKRLKFRDFFFGGYITIKGNSSAENTGFTIL
jgi:hypothetical protein